MLTGWYYRKGNLPLQDCHWPNWKGDWGDLSYNWTPLEGVGSSLRSLQMGPQTQSHILVPPHSQPRVAISPPNLPSSLCLVHTTWPIRHPCDGIPLLCLHSPLHLHGISWSPVHTSKDEHLLIDLHWLEAWYLDEWWWWCLNLIGYHMWYNLYIWFGGSEVGCAWCGDQHDPSNCMWDHHQDDQLFSIAFTGCGLWDLRKTSM